MKVPVKLTIGFLIPVLCIWVITFYSANNFNLVHNKFEFLMEDIVPRTISIVETERACIETTHELMEYVLHGEEQSEQAIQLLLKQMERLELYLLKQEELQGLEKDEKVLGLQEIIKEFRAAVSEIIELKKRGMSIDELLIIEDKTIHQRLVTLNEQLANHKSIHFRKLAESEKFINDTFITGKQSIFLAGILISMLTIVIAYLISKSITNPLRVLHEGTEEISQGNLDYKVGTKAKDEIGQLSRAFDAMSQNLKETTTSIENLNKETAERERIMEKLQESREVWRSLVYNIPDIVMTSDVDGKILFINHTVPGLNVEDVVGKNLRDVTLPEHIETLMNSIRRVFKTGELFTFEVSGTGPDGGISHYSTRIGPIKHNGEVISAIQVTSDITERKRNEEIRETLMHEMGERIKELRCMYGVARATRESDSHGEMLKKAVKFIPLGWHYPEITVSRITVNGNEYATENFRESEWKQTTDIIVNDERFGSIEVYYLEECPILDEGPFLKEERELIEGIAHSLGETIERMKAEEAIRENEEKFTSLASSVNDAILLMDNHGLVSYWNPAAETIFGHTDVEVLGRNLHELIVPERYHEAFKKAFPEFAKTGQGGAIGKSLELVAKRKNGEEFPVELYFTKKKS